MNPSRSKKIFLILAIIIFVLGSLLTLSHIKYGAELLLFAIVLLALRLIPQIVIFLSRSTTDKLITSYPGIGQSIGITALNIIMAILIIKVQPTINLLVGKEASLLVCELLIVGIPLFIAYLIRRRLTNNNSFNLRMENIRIIPYIIIGSVVLLIGIASPIGNLIPMPESLEKYFMDFGSQTGIFTFLLFVIAAPILEELLFRGIILEGLLGRYSPLISIILSSLLFGLSHMNPWSSINGFVIGSFSGWVYFKTRSVLPSIIIHASANFCGIVIRYFIDINSLMNDSLNKIFGGTSNLILSVVLSIIIATLCILFLNKEFQINRTRK
jgi:uncharacterized protein